MNMHRIFIFFMLIAGLGCSRNTAEIKGLVEGGGEKTISLERLDVNRTIMVDSVKSKRDGSFFLKTRLDEPELFILKNEQGEIVNLLLAPGEKVTISTSSESFGSGYEIDGSDDSEMIRQLVEHMDRTRIEA